jgi:hypothetical protein
LVIVETIHHCSNPEFLNLARIRLGSQQPGELRCVSSTNSPPSGETSGTHKYALRKIAALPNSLLKLELRMYFAQPEKRQQATALSYFDDFWMFAVVPAALVFLVLFMKRSVAEKGAHIRAE